MSAMIEIREFPANAPEQYLEPDGRLLLDLGPNFGFSLSKAATEGNEVNQIKREGTKSFSVPLTEKNRWIFRKWIFPNVLERDFTRMKVYAYDGAHQLPEDRLDVLRADISGGTIELGLFESEELGLVDGANTLFLNTVDFGTFTLTEANLESNWDAAQWEDGVTQDFYFGLVHYGNFIVDASEVSPEDFRPLLSVPATLLRGFCTLGWVFDTPLFESDWFGRLWWYGLGPEYYRHSGWGRLSRLDVEVTADIAVPVVDPPIWNILFDTENADEGNSHAIAIPPGSASLASIFTRTQARAGNVTYRITGQIENTSVSPDDTFVVLAIRMPGAGDVVAFDFSVLWGATVDVDVTFTENFPEGITFVVALMGYTAPLAIKQGFKITATPAEPYYHMEDVVDIRESIHPDYTFLDFLQGMAHMGFRFDIQHGLRRVTMYQPEDGQVFGQGPFDGYFRPAHEAQDWTERMQHDSAVFDFPKEDIPETLVIGFKESTDKLIEGMALPEETPLYAKRITFPSGVRRQVEVNENPFFEPTANFQWFGQATPQISTPAMWDNTERRRSFEIGPRLLYAQGKVFQANLDGTARQWSYLGVLRSTMPFVFQAPEAMVGPSAQVPDAYIAYDRDGGQWSLWEMFLRLDNRFWKDLPKVSVLLHLTNTDYHKFSFRDRLVVYILGRPTTFKALAVRDFQTNQEIPTPVTLQVDPADAC